MLVILRKYRSILNISIGVLFVFGYWVLYQSVYNQGNNAVVVAVLDAGVDYTDTFIQPFVWDGSRCYDVHGQFHGKCMYGFDFVDRDTNPFPEDESDHGTAVAHILITSFMEKSHLNSLRIMSVRVASKNQVESTAVANGIMFALANNASIINISVSFPEETPELRNALRLAYEQNVPVVVSAGNFSTNMDVIPMYPASSVFPNIITVSALDTHGELSSYSNYGSAIDILATGESFIKSGHTGILKKYTGTSFSAAMVSGYLAAQESAGISNNEAFTSLDSTFVVQSGTEAKVLQYIP